MAVYSSGPQGGIAFDAPLLNRLESITTFTSNGVTNPLDDNAPHDFRRIIGLQLLIVTRYSGGLPAFTWMLELSGGYNANSNGYIGSFDPSANYIVMSQPLPTNSSITYLNAGPTPVFTSNIQVQTTDTAIGSPIYVVSYSPYAQVAPKITLQAPFALGADDLQVKTVYYRPANR